ncbi:MAG: hypothetical protein U1B79_01780 [Candidatus Pacearchaeota archaeon]|nr:hypothetical protein [Nanoarchaeota archaeon]MDZ4226817.1 hypothetical protein [Candidatus Pacearchaeota archaeon]
MEKQRILEIGAAALFVILLVMASVVIVSAYRNPKTETTITNSYNTYNTYPARTELVSSKPYIIDTSDYRDRRVYYFDDLRYDKDKDSRYDSSNRRYLMHDDVGNFRTYKGVVGNRVNSYEVYVRNREYVGGDFKTVFYFEDYYGNVDSESMTHYIPAREEKRFVLKHISPSRYDYRSWWYQVEPLTKAPSRNYLY